MPASLSARPLCPRSEPRSPVRLFGRPFASGCSKSFGYTRTIVARLVSVGGRFANLPVIAIKLAEPFRFRFPSERAIFPSFAMLRLGCSNRTIEMGGAGKEGISATPELRTESRGILSSFLSLSPIFLIKLATAMYKILR